MHRLPSHHRPVLGHTDSYSQFFYTNAVYDHAYKTISNALRARRGLVLLVGEGGTGKTKLMRLLSTTLEEQIRFCMCASPPTTLRELLALFDDLLVLHNRRSEIPLKLEEITDRLRMWAYRKGTTVLVIDDAHTLSNTALNQLSLLLELDSTFGPLLQIVLVGRPELEAKLATPELCHIQARVAVRSQLIPLQAEEVRLFIQHRYRTPRGLRQHLFTPEAVDRIAHHSQAIPGRINILSQGALIAAYTQGQIVVTAETVEELAVKLSSASHSESAVRLPDPTPSLIIECEDALKSSVQDSDILHVRHRIIRFGRALVAVGLGAIILLAGLLVGKQVPMERLTTAFPLMIERTKKTLSFFPQSMSADSVPVHQGHSRHSLQQKPQKLTNLK